MAKREPSFLKDIPDPKRPNSALALRSDSLDAEESSKMAFGVKLLNEFDNTQFPRNIDVIGRYFFERNRFLEKRTVKSIASLLFEELVVIYNKGIDIPTPTKKKDNSLTAISKLIDNYRSAQKNSNRGRKLTAKEELFVNNLPKMFDIIADNAEDQIRNDRLRTDKDKLEDIDFLKDQRTERKQRLGKLDGRHAKKVDAKLLREENLLQRRLQQTLNVESPVRPKQQPVELMPTKLRSKLQNPDRRKESSSSDEDLESSTGQYAVGSRKIELDQDFAPSRFLREHRNPRQKSQKVSVIKDSATLQALDRDKVSSRAGVRILAPAVAATGGDIMKQAFSHSTLHRERTKMRLEVAAEIKASFQSPKRSNIQYDGKMIWDSSGEHGDFLAVVLSGDSPDCPKVLSAKMIEDGKGINQAKEVVSVLKEWGCEGNVCSMCFDTTSSNTGWIKGACVLIEKMLGRPLLWNACRHHIPELILRAVWEILFGKDMSPFYKDFEDFQASWDDIDKNNFEFLNPNRNERKWMKEIRNRVVSILESILQSEKQPRDDYKEVLELVLILLSAPPQKFTFKKPGAYNKARWMAILIYGIKMYLFRSQLGKDKNYIEKLRRFVIFASLFYAEYWFAAPIAAEAPFMDLQFYKQMLEYQKHDSEVAEAALDKFLGHTWYLNQEMVPYSLFSKRVSDIEKQDIAKKLTKVKPPKKYEMGYPNPVPLPKDRSGLSRTLSDSIMNGSLFLFDVMGFGKDWLYKPVSDWEKDPSFCEMKSYFKTLNVTNDCAERGVKLISEYANSLTKNPEERQNLLQVVERHRRNINKTDKKTLARPLGASSSKN